MSKKLKISSDLIEEANESLRSSDVYPSEDGRELLKSLEFTSIEEKSLKNPESPHYEVMIEKITSSLSKIEKKIDLDNLHLKKLDKLDKLNELDVLKKEVMKMENNRIAGKANEQEITNTGKNNNNLPDASEILNRIDEVDEKIRKVEQGVKKNELTNTYFQKRFTNIESTMDRFEDLEKEIKIEYAEDDNTLKKNKYLKISLLLLLLIFATMIAADRLGFVDLYIDEIIRSFF
jgi:hypothetical protein